jgi:phenylalanyl-tRNA synthetase beta chain
LPVKVSAPDLCGRFSGRIVRNVNTRAKTPQWMVDRLARCGQRSVSPLVDISNYVMFELGRPSHIFDLDKIHGGLDVRWGKPGEQLKLLNGNTVTVDEKVGVIADDSQVESLAGIMGGDATAVSDDTRNIYIEAAFWWPKAVAGRSRRFQLLDRCRPPLRARCGPEPDGGAHRAHHPAGHRHLRHARHGRPDGRPGSEPAGAQARDAARGARRQGHWHAADASAMCGALQRLGLPVVQGEGTLTVTPPTFRFDITIEEDLIEEVARMVGYNNLPTTPPLAPITPKLRAEATRSPFAVRRCWPVWGTRRPSTSALWKSAGSMSWPAMCSPSSCSTRLPAR